jgi:SH3-like domain-containing protein
MDRVRSVRRRAVRVVASWLATASLLVTASIAGAAEFRSVGASPAILYDAPSRQSVRQFVAPPGMPLEVISTLGQWVKVRDMAGDVMWIERAELAERRMLVAVARASVHASPDEASPVVMVVERGVLLEPFATLDVSLQVPEGWLGVRHRDGDSGFVRATDVWGR